MSPHGRPKGEHRSAQHAASPVRPRRRLMHIAPALAVALLAGCASMAPPYERPAAPVAAVFTDEPAAGTPSAVPAADIDWQQFFVDPRLQRLIALALQNNRDLRVAVLNIERVRAQYQIQRSEQFPTVILGATSLSEPNSDGNGSSNYYTAGLNITGYELDLFGRVRSLGDAALQQYFASQEARKAAQISLVAGVANTYLTLLADELQLEVTRKTLDTRLESYRLLKLKLDNGASSDYEVAQAVSLVEGARAALALFTRQRTQDRNALELLVGQPLPADLPQGLPLQDQGLLAELPAGLPAELLERRPDVRQAERQLQAANANIGAARAAFFPRITLTGSVGLASEDLGGLFDNRAWQFAPRITLPIFDAGANQANLELSQANRDIAVAQYERSIQTAFREVADALAGRATLGEQLRAQQAQAQAEEQRFRLADLRFQNGASSYLDVLEAQRALFQTQQAAVVAQAAQQQNLVQLYKVLGGGWKGSAH
jgi:outer membrane protein, multidrug efflux system